MGAGPSSESGVWQVVGAQIKEQCGKFLGDDRVFEPLEFDFSLNLMYNIYRK